MAIAVAIYLVRSAVRGFDFRPDLPADAVILVLLVIVLAIVAYVRRAYGDNRMDGDDPTDTGGE